MANTIKNTATPMKERLKGFGQIAIAGIILALLVGVAFAVVNAHGDDDNAKPAKEPNTEDKSTYKFFAGLKLKEIATEDTYILTDGEVTMLYINETAIKENLDKDLPNKITQEDALRISYKLCGKGYNLERITENPYDFDILYKRYINGVEVFGGNCYVSINSKTGKIGAYRKLIFDIPQLGKPKISKEMIKKKTGGDVDLVVIPHLNKLFWMIKEGRLIRMFDANTGKEIDEIESEKMMKEVMKTDEGIGNLKKKSTDVRYSTKSINNNQGAVFEDGSSSPEHTDDIQAAENSMEKQRPNNQPAWDTSVTNAGIRPSVGNINYIFKNYEGVYASTHGNNNCLSYSGWSYCTGDMDWGLQTSLFVTPACYTGNNFATQLYYHGVECVIAPSGTTGEPWWLNECGNWADGFWDKVTGNKDAGYKRDAHTARVETNSDTWTDYCDLDTERGLCNLYI